MSTNTTSNRRSFLKRGALLAAPLAAAAPAVLADEAHALKARLAKLEDEAAIRELHQNWLRRINAGDRDAAKPPFADTQDMALDSAARSVAANHSAEPDVIEIASDSNSASGRFHCLLEIESTIPQDCTLAQMAHEQGSGFIRRTQRGVLKVEYAKTFGAWTIAKIKFETV